MIKKLGFYSENFDFILKIPILTAKTQNALSIWKLNKNIVLNISDLGAAVFLHDFLC